MNYFKRLSSKFARQNKTLFFGLRAWKILSCKKFNNYRLSSFTQFAIIKPKGEICK